VFDHSPTANQDDLVTSLVETLTTGRRRAIKVSAAPSVRRGPCVASRGECRIKPRFNGYLVVACTPSCRMQLVPLQVDERVPGQTSLPLETPRTCLVCACVHIYVCVRVFVFFWLAAEIPTSWRTCCAHRYKEMCSFANEMGKPELIYRFLSLASHHALWNTRGGAGFGLEALLQVRHHRAHNAQDAASCPTTHVPAFMLHASCLMLHASLLCCLRSRVEVVTRWHRTLTTSSRGCTGTNTILPPRSATASAGCGRCSSGIPRRPWTSTLVPS